jgi:hypothetical protein
VEILQKKNYSLGHKIAFHLAAPQFPIFSSKRLDLNRITLLNLTGCYKNTHFIGSDQRIQFVDSPPQFLRAKVFGAKKFWREQLLARFLGHMTQPTYEGLPRFVNAQLRYEKNTTFNGSSACLKM